MFQVFQANFNMRECSIWTLRLPVPHSTLKRRRKIDCQLERTVNSVHGSSCHALSCFVMLHGDSVGALIEQAAAVESSCLENLHLAPRVDFTISSSLQLAQHAGFKFWPGNPHFESLRISCPRQSKVLHRFYWSLTSILGCLSYCLHHFHTKAFTELLPAHIRSVPSTK